MSTNHNLKKLAANTVLAGGLGLAVIGLAAGVAHAAPVTPVPSPNPAPSLPIAHDLNLTILPPSCSQAGGNWPLPAKATLANFAQGTVRLFEDSLNGTELAPQQITGREPVTVHFSWYGEPPRGNRTPQLWVEQSLGSQTLTAHCDISLANL